MSQTDIHVQARIRTRNFSKWSAYGIERFRLVHPNVF
jgi:hypothetical protein